MRAGVSRAMADKDNYAGAIAWINAVQEWCEKNDPHGIPYMNSTDPYQLYDIPDNHCLVSSFDADLWKKSGRYTGRAWRATGARVNLGPQVDIGSNIVWTRLGGSICEDPASNRDLCKSFGGGMQSTWGDDACTDDKGWGKDSVAIMLKHYVGAGAVEGGRNDHNDAGKYDVFPGDNFNAHLIPFLVKLADHSVELRNVSYSYDGSKKALDGISLKIGSGQTCAFVGPSGGGKTTLANIISRFFDADSGEVLIGGVNVRDFPKEQLMDTVSFVFQNSRLIKGTILENVRMARPEASDEEVLRALEAAQCGDILEKLPDGVNTVIGTGGIYLSGGEQQRVAIARVILKDSPVVILDEATAFADPDNEVRVQKAFAELLKGRTVIMIAHRLSTVINADRIFVLADGKIAESGSGAELSSGDGIFAKMWSDYRKSVDWKIEKEGAR